MRRKPRVEWWLSLKSRRAPPSIFFFFTHILATHLALRKPFPPPKKGCSCPAFCFLLFSKYFTAPLVRQCANPFSLCYWDCVPLFCASFYFSLCSLLPSCRRRPPSGFFPPSSWRAASRRSPGAFFFRAALPLFPSPGP